MARAEICEGNGKFDFKSAQLHKCTFYLQHKMYRTELNHSCAMIPISLTGNAHLHFIVAAERNNCISELKTQKKSSEK